MMNIRALRVGLRVTEVASFEHQRRYGEGGLKTFPDGWRVLRTILAERLRRADFDLSGPLRARFGRGIRVALSAPQQPGDEPDHRCRSGAPRRWSSTAI